jgi:hypothetical protein
MNDTAGSWQPQFQVNGKWHGNGYRFGSRKRALEFAESVAARRALRGDPIGEVRAVPMDEPVNRKEDE